LRQRNDRALVGARHGHRGGQEIPLDRNAGDIAAGVG
jgi:hypothetical protein